MNDLVRKTLLAFDTVDKKARQLFYSNKPVSEYLLTGDGLCSQADHVFNTQFTAYNVKRNQSIFVKTEEVESFFLEHHPKIFNPYTLITHNSDAGIGSNYLKYIDHKIVHWYAQNLITRHDKLSILPIGFENSDLALNGDETEILLMSSKRTITKRPYRFSAIFNVDTNTAERNHCLKQIESTDQTLVITKRVPHHFFLKKLLLTQFTICPEGNGVDTHRVWEALAMGSIPVMKYSQFTTNIHHLGVPLLIIRDWSDLNKLTNTQLQNLFMLYQNTPYRRLLTLQYWTKQIKTKSYDTP